MNTEPVQPSSEDKKVVEIEEETKGAGPLTIQESEEPAV
jgi:hypothetical protein